MQAAANLAEHDSLPAVTVVEGQASSTEDVEAVLRGTKFDALVNCAGFPDETVKSYEQARVSTFHELIKTLVDAAEKHGPKRCCFIAGFGALDVPGVDKMVFEYLPSSMGAKYMVHKANWDLMEDSNLDWTLYCPGPLVIEDPIPVEGMRLTKNTVLIDRRSAWHMLIACRLCCFFFLLKSSLPQMTVAFGDLANVIVSQITPEGKYSRARVGIANPIGFTRTTDKAVSPLDKKK